MPTYEYACRACGHSFDSVQSMSDSALTICPQCGGELRKIFHPAGIAFKGSGFYATDNRKGTKAAAKSGPSPEGGGSSSGGSGDNEGSSSTAGAGGSDTTSSKGSSKGSSEGGDPKPKSAKTKGESKDKAPSAKGSSDRGAS